MNQFLLLAFIILSSIIAKAQFSDEIALNHVASDATAVIAVDLDNDGDNDVISASENDDKIAWYENLGGGTFGVQRTISTSVDGANNVISADLDGDLLVDIVATSFLSNEIVWFKNMGNGSFSQKIVITNNTNGIMTIVSVDIDLDGDLDIMSGSDFDNKIAWYENLGNGNFSTQQSITTQANGVSCIFYTDINGDGDKDILFSFSNSIGWIENLGLGIFGPIQTIGSSVSLTSVYATDLDLDGDNDVLFTSFGDHVGWIENIGGGSFNAKQTLYLVNDARSVYTADVDNDGDQDVLSASYSDNTIAWCENFGNGNFGNKVVISNLAEDATAVYALDLDGDGFFDVCSASAWYNKIAWYKNLGNNTFGPEEILTSPTAEVTTIYVNDVNGDGDVDVLSSSHKDGFVSWYENLGNNNFSEQTIITFINDAHDIVLEDLDNDGDNDLLVTCINPNKIVWFENLGNGSFGGQVIVGISAGYCYSVVTNDADGDGDLDIFTVSDSNDEMYWFENLGSGIFSSSVTIASITSKHIHTADIDGDGDLDFVLNDHDVFWVENLGGGLFSSVQNVSTVTSPTEGKTFVTDLDGDGDNDIIWGSTGTLSWFENLGGGNFNSIALLSNQAWNILGLYAEDINDDGAMDIVTGGDELLWHENLGGATGFSSPLPVASLVSWSNNVIVKDVDNDGDVDVISAEGGIDKLSLYENKIYDNIQLNGSVFIDINQNNNYDSTDIGFSQIQLNSTPQSDFTFSWPNGNYFMNFSDTMGTYIIQPENLTNWSIVTDSLSYTIVIDSSYNTMDSLNFGFYPDTLIDEIQLELVGGFPRCNDTINYWLNFRNIGTTIPSGVIKLELDSNLLYVTSNVVPDSVIGQNIYWHFDSLMYFTEELINIEVGTPNFMFMGNSLTSIVETLVIDTLGIISFSSSDTLSQILLCAYDPNDKIVTPKGIDSMGYISPNTTELEFTIRFQNTGSDTAINVTITDQLDQNLNWQSFTPLASSHPATIDINQNGNIEFNFNNIMLPDSNVNELASHGFIKYRIDLLPSLPLNTSIYNTANIYFDENPAVVTNTTINTLYECVDTIPFGISNSSLCIGDILLGNVTDDLSTTIFTWNITDVFNQNGENISWESDTVGLFDLIIQTNNSLCLKDSTIQVNVSAFPVVNLNEFNSDTICIDSDIMTLPLASPSGGTYTGNGVMGSEFDPNLAGLGEQQVYYSYTNTSGCMSNDSAQVVVSSCTGIESYNLLNLSIHPNPFSNYTTVSFGQDLEEDFSLYIYDLLGKEVYTKKITTDKVKLFKNQLSTGVFILTVVSSTDSKVHYRTRLVIE